MRKQRAYILIGLPGAGKSTWSKRQIEKGSNPNGCVIVSRDAIRNMLNGDYKYIESQQSLITKIAADTAKSILDRGQDLIVDQANINTRDRKEVTDFIVREVGNREDVEIYFVSFIEQDTETLVSRRFYGDARGEDEQYHRDVINKLKAKYESIEDNENFDVLMTMSRRGDILDIYHNAARSKMEAVESIPREELWDLGHTLSRYILPRLKAFRDGTPGCPGGIGYEKDGTKMYSMRRGPDPKGQLCYEKWNGILDRMILAFELELSCHDWDCEVNSKEYNANWAKVEEGLNLFAKYYNGLWW